MNQQEELVEFLSIVGALISLLEPLDDERINRVPFPGSWTAGQLGDHLLKSYCAVDWVEIRATPLRRTDEGKSAQIDGVFLDFTTRYQPPDFIVPSTGEISGRELVADLRRAADGIAAYAQERDLAFTCPEFNVIGFGDLTAQEWIHFLTAHSKRHVRQLRNILNQI